MHSVIQEDENELSQIQDFKKGYVYFLSGLQNLVSSFLQYLTSGNISEANKRDLLPFRKALDTELNNNQKKIKDIIINLDEKHMYPLVKKEYARYFVGIQADTDRNDFVQFHLIFEMLRNFVIDTKGGWESIRASIEAGTFQDPEFKQESLLKFRILPALDRIQFLTIFLKRMAHILQIENPKAMWDMKPTKPKFRAKVVYRLSTVFSENLYQGGEVQEAVAINIPFETETNGNGSVKAEPSAVVVPPQEKKPATSDVSAKPPNKKESVVNYIQAFGKYSWNSDQHYFFRFETDKYSSEKDLFKQTISMDIHMGADEQVLRAELIRSLTSLEKKNKSGEELEKEYLGFLNHFFDFCENIIMMNMGIPTQLKWVFLFHIGPSHFYMIAKKFLTEVNTGYLHVKSSDGKRVARVIPGEVVKKHVIDYWNRVVLPNVGEEKNNLALMKKLTEIVEQKYKETSAHAITEYDNLPSDIKASKPRVQLFREYMNQWMGAANIIIFKRFVKNKSI